MNYTARNKRGSGLMMVIVLGLAAMILVLAAISFAYGSLSFAATRTNYINSLMLAESALNHTIKTAHVSPVTFQGIEKVPANPGLEGQELVNWLWEDAPGVALEDDKKMCLQEGDYAIGVATDGEYVRACRVKFTLATPPTMPAAMYIESQDVVPNINGASTSIDGHDYLALSTDPDGPGDPTHGLALSNADSLQAWIDLFAEKNMKSKQDAIQGVDPSPDYLDTGIVPGIAEMVEAYGLMPTMVIEDETSISGGSWGTPTEPEIVLIKGNVRIQGITSGCGVLIIEGDLELRGNFTWQGLVIVKGNFTVGSGSAEIWGAEVICDTNASVNVEIGGSFDLRYSTQALSYISGLVLVHRDSWEEL